jgi:16S rRNA C1402 (ribose-2'-O) methylase RsmI
VGLVSSSGVPCFVDPGAWLVREARARGVPVVALGGASSLSTLLALSGYDWIDHPPTRAFSFVFFEPGADPAYFRAVVGRREEPVVVYLPKGGFDACLAELGPLAGGRAVTAFFDLTRPPRTGFPYANEVRTLSCAAWRRRGRRIRWDKVSDVALLVEPARKRRPS